MTSEVPRDAPTPLGPVDPPSSTDSILDKLRPGDDGLKHEGEIARGGMGAIEKVRDDALRRDLAMKVMLPEGQQDALYVHRFLEEAQVTAQLDHPGVVPVHQLGRGLDGRLFFTMKLVKLTPTIDALFEQLAESKQVVARLRKDFTGRRREVALQLALARAVSQRPE